MTDANNSPPDSSGAGPRVALYGTFDVLNYGDLLFPLLLRDRLGIPEEDFHAYSPRGGKPAWDDTVPCLPIETAADYSADLHVIGGGNIIHATSTPLPDYAETRFGAQGSYAALWLGAGLIAAQTGGRIAWNAPGLPHPLLRGPVRTLSDAILAASAQVTVRDEASRNFLGKSGDASVQILPDTALDLAALWPAADLRAIAEAAFARQGMAVPDRWVAVHVNSRYLDADEAEQGRQVAALADRLNAVPVLIAIGPCHGDDQLAQRVGALLPIPVLVLDQPEGLKEIAALIAHAACYVGSSMHGLITALAYEKPALVIARPRMVKFAGFLEQLGMTERLSHSWAEALGKTALMTPLQEQERSAINTARARIADHWARLRALLHEPMTERETQAMDRLRHWIADRPEGQRDWQSFEAVLPVLLPQAVSPISKPFHCNICGGKTVRPNRRQADDMVGHDHICAGCNGTARHRAMRQVLEVLRSDPALRTMGLQYGRHRVAAGGWFAQFDLIAPTHEGSTLVAPPADKRYAMILCLDMLEQVADIQATLMQLWAALADDGVLLLSFRTVPTRQTTLEWGFPRGDDHGRLRAFGTDMLARLDTYLPDAFLTFAWPSDPYSDTETVLCIATGTQARHDWIQASAIAEMARSTDGLADRL